MEFEGEWEQDVIPTEDIMPHYSEQEHYTVHMLLTTGTIQGLSSNVAGDLTYIDSNSPLFEKYPKDEKECLEEYAIRVLGMGNQKLSQEQQEARDYLKSKQMDKEWSKEHAYHFKDFVPLRSNPSLLSFSSNDKRKTNMQVDNKSKRPRGEEEE